MQPDTDGGYDVAELSEILMRERLFITSEQRILQSLNEKVEQSAAELMETAWIYAQQRLNLNNLIAHRGDPAPLLVCQRAHALQLATFTDAHKVLRYQDALAFSELFQLLRETPRLLAICLMLGERSCPELMPGLIHSLCAGLYASCILDTDRILVLRILRCLIRHQIAASEDPRKLVRSGTCSFNRLYGSFRDGHTPARHFLCATLHSPIMRLLHEDEFYLDIDPDNTLERFSAADRLRKFGQPNSPEYAHRLSRYRKWIVTALANLAERFISALAENWACFPSSLSMIVRQTAIALKESGNVSEKEIHYICTDLVLTQYICPAIANPEPYGIIDTQMSYVARFNLKQMAQIVQTLSFMKYHDVEPKMRDLFSRFDKDCVSSLIDILVSNPSCSSSLSDVAVDDFPCNGELSAAILREAESCGINGLQTVKTEPTIVTNAAYFTKSELHIMVNFLQSISSSLNNNMSSKSTHLLHNNCDVEYAISGLTLYDRCQTDGGLLSTNGGDGDFTSHGLSENKHEVGEVDSSDTSSTSSADNPDQFNNGYISTASDGLNLLVQSLDSAYKSRLHDLLKRLPDLSANSPDTHGADTLSNAIPEPQPKKGLLSKVPKPKLSRNSSSNTTALQVLNIDDGARSNGSRNDGEVGTSSSTFVKSERGGSVKTLRPNVLVIRLPGAGSEEPIGLLSESKIMEHYYNQVNPAAEILESVAILDSVDLDGVEDDVLMDMVGAESVGGGPIVDGSHHGKRTRFSLSHDEVSIGNTSDNLEVVSEAASNHSVTSSLELEETEDQNDNLSDMVSANVSGRGSPNISGRDTPSSQVTEGAGEGEGGGNGNSLAPPNADRVIPNSGQNQSAASQQAKLLKQARNEIEDKFCKFEIKKLLEGDETISIISDTWSTDVLASDSETIGESCYDRNFIITPGASTGATLAAGLANSGISAVGPNMDINGGLGGLAAVPIQLSEPSETASESAWSIDVLASDSDRMTEVDTDDCVSVTARSDSSAPAVSRPSAATPTQSAPRALHHHQVPTFVNLPPPPGSRQSRRTCGSRTTTSTGSGFGTGSTSTLVTNASPIHRLSNMSPLYYSAENAIAHGGEVDFSNLRQVADQADGYSPSEDNINSISILKERKSILVNGYPVMTCFSSSRGRNDVGVAPPSPPTQEDEPVEAVQADNPFNPFNNPEERLNDPADEPGPGSSDTQQLPSNEFHQHQAYRFEPDPWLDETVDTRPGYYKGKQNIAFRPVGSVNVPPAAENSEYKQRMIDIYYRNNGLDYGSEPSHADTSFNSTYSSFSTSSTNPFDSNFEQNAVEVKPLETAAPSHTTLSDLVAKMTTTLTTSASIVGNLTSRVVKSSVISISSSRIERTLKRDKASPSNGVPSNSAISLSTLSVNSADTSTSEKSSSQDINSENVTERRVTPPLCPGKIDSNAMAKKSSTPYKPTTSTGAIPKSISFDRITEKAQSLHRRSSSDVLESAGTGMDDGKSNNAKRAGNFFNKIKLFRNRGRGMPPIDIGKRDCLDARLENVQASDTIEDAFISKVDETAPKTPETIESTDDILAKYRRKPSSGGSSDSNSLPLHHRRSSKRGSVSRRSSDIISSDDALLIDDRLNGELTLDLGNPDTFNLLKKKLKMVLSNPDLEYAEYLSHCCVAGTVSSWSFPSDDIGLSAMGNEALRWCRAAGNVGTRRAVADLKRDARRERKRAAYMAECRRGLLSAIAMLERQHRSAQRFSMSAASTATGIRAARQLTACSALKGLTHPSNRDHRQHNGHGGEPQATAADERATRIVGTIEAITSEIRTDCEWDGAADWQLETLDRTVERAVFARVYLHVMFPNGEGDIARDQVLQDHIRRLSECGAGLPSSRCRSGGSGAPWPSAQAHLAALSVYRAPTDKVRCVVRCATTIMAMLSSEEGTVPSADDFTPVLVYVIIKVNPPLLLSTIQFVNNFHILEGEGLYWWTQFCAAVQFIKTMEYHLKSPLNNNI